MFKLIKQDKKIKTFKKAYKSIHNPCSTELNGKIEKDIEWNAIAFNQKIPKKRMPKDKDVFGKKPAKK